MRELRPTAADERTLHGRTRRVLSAQADCLELVRAILRLKAGEERLDGLGGVSARLVSRLERIESALPQASESVGGARRLKQWALAEIAATEPAPLPVVAPTPPPLEPPPTATPRPDPTPAPTSTATPEPISEEHTEDDAVRILPHRRARLRHRLATRAARSAIEPGGTR